MKREIPAAVILAAVLVIIAIAIIVLALMDSRDSDQPLLSGTGIPANPATPGITRVTSTETPRSRPVEEYPGSSITPASVSPTDRSTGKAVNGCSLVANQYGYIYYNTSVFNAESAGKYSNPARKKDPGITIGQAKDIAMMVFREYSPDRVEITHEEGTTNNRPVWKFDLYKDEQQVALGELNPDGEIMSYIIPGADNSIKYHMRPELLNTSPAITLESARVTAENEIRERNGEIPLKLMISELKYGNYVFIYHRIIHGVPSGNNYVNIGVNPGTGQVSNYFKTWSTPENAVAEQMVPAVSREAAIAVVERIARPCYPESADSFRIVSADLQWMDVYNDNEFTPKPGVIPLGWYVRFDDTTIQEMNNRREGEAWVDAQNGTLLSLYYIHNGS